MLLITSDGKKYFDDQLLRYMRERNESKVKEILKNCNPAGLIDSSQSTLLHYAAKYGNANLISYLVKAGCQVDCQDEHGKTALIYAVEENYEFAVKDLLGENIRANLYVKDNQGRSALQLACDTKICRSSKIVEMCIDRVSKQYEGSNDEIAKKLIEANCPLYFAIHAKNSAVTKFLIDHGLPVNCRDPTNGETALHVAAKIADVENTRLLVKCGADVNAVDRLRRKPFFNTFPINDTDQGLETLRILLDGGMILTSLNFKGKMQAQPLERCNNRFMELVFEYDVDFMAKDEMGNTLMHFLAHKKNLNYEKLKDKKFDITMRNKDGKTAVELAFECNNEEYVDFLLDNGSNIDNPSDTLLHLLIPNETTERDGRQVRTARYQRNPKFLNAMMRCDKGIKFVLENGDKIFDYSLQQYDCMANYVIALAAMLDASGVEIEYILHDTINQKPAFHKLYENYKDELKKMKATIIHKSVTLYKLLTENKKVIELYVRDKDLVAKYAQMEREFNSNSYYIDVLQKRVKKAIQMVELKSAAKFAFCQLVGMDADIAETITENIFKYLDEIDLNNLISAQRDKECEFKVIQ